MDQVVAELLACLDNPFLAMLQWEEVFSVVEVSFASSGKLVLKDWSCI